jgi:hypothetical protein
MQTELQKRVAKAKVEGIDNAYIAISAYHDSDNDELTKRMSFFYVASDTCIIEWEPKHGPITVIYKCDENWSDGHSNAEPHWYFDYCTGHGNWAQLAVDERQLKQAFARGSYDYIFAVLAEYGD